MNLSSLSKLGQYAKTGFDYAKKATKVLIHESMGDGHTVIAKGRKSVGGGYTIFQNSKAKTKAGWDILKSDIKATANKPGIFAKAKTAYKSGVLSEAKEVLRNGGKVNSATKLLGGLKGIKNAVTTSIKSAYKSGAFSQMRKVLAKGGKITNATKIWGGIKGLAKPLCKAPLIYTALVAVTEGPKIYKAYKNGGFWAGTKELGKVAAGVAVGGALGALGTVIGGPVLGAIAFGIGETITRSLLGDSESAPAETKDDDNLAQAQVNGIMPEEIDTTELRDKLRELEAQESEAETQKPEESEQAEASAQEQSELPATLQASDIPAQGTTNPFAQNNNQYSNPFGFDAGTNIFQAYPAGYKFQYQGNGFGMMA